MWLFTYVQKDGKIRIVGIYSTLHWCKSLGKGEGSGESRPVNLMGQHEGRLTDDLCD